MRDQRLTTAELLDQCLTNGPHDQGLENEETRQLRGFLLRAREDSNL